MIYPLKIVDKESWYQCFTVSSLGGSTSQAFSLIRFKSLTYSIDIYQRQVKIFKYNRKIINYIHLIYILCIICVYKKCEV